MHWVRRSLPPGARHVDGIRLVAARARRADVVYTTGMLGRSSLGSLLARTPFVIKLTADPAYERARRWGLWRGSLEEFQRARRPGDAAAAARARRRRAPRGARDHAVGVSARARARLGRPAGARDRAAEPGAAGARAAGRATSFARRVRHRRPDARVRGPADGAEVARRRDRGGAARGRRARDRRRRARPRGARAARPRALPRPAAARAACSSSSAPRDASLLSSSWENFPHTVVEALAVGTPVIATRTGGVAEVVRDGENGLVVEPDDVDALAAAIRRFFADAGLAGAAARERRARRSADYAPERVYGRLEQILLEAASDDSPRVLFVGRTDYRLPLDESLARKWDALVRADGPARPRERHRADPRFHLVAAATARRAALLRVAAAAGSRVSCATFRPDVVVAQSPYEAVAVELARRATRSPAKLVVEVHGDWHTVDAALRLARPRRRSARSATASPAGRCGAPTRHRAVSEFTGVARARPRAASRPACSRPTPTSAHSRGRSLPVPEEPRVALRRRARALQERRGARGGVADRGGPRARRRSCAWSATGPGRRRRGARARGGRVGPAPRAAGSSRRRSTVARALAASVGFRGPAARRRSRRSCAAAGRSAARAGGIPDIVQDERERPARRAGRQRRAGGGDRADADRSRARSPAWSGGRRASQRGGSRPRTSTPTTFEPWSTPCSRLEPT